MIWSQHQPTSGLPPPRSVTAAARAHGGPPRAARPSALARGRVGVEPSSRGAPVSRTDDVVSLEHRARLVAGELHCPHAPAPLRAPNCARPSDEGHGESGGGIRHRSAPLATPCWSVIRLPALVLREAEHMLGNDPSFAFQRIRESVPLVHTTRTNRRTSAFRASLSATRRRRSWRAGGYGRCRRGTPRR